MVEASAECVCSPQAAGPPHHGVIRGKWKKKKRKGRKTHYALNSLSMEICCAIVSFKKSLSIWHHLKFPAKVKSDWRWCRANSKHQYLLESQYPMSFGKQSHKFNKQLLNNSRRKCISDSKQRIIIFCWSASTPSPHISIFLLPPIIKRHIYLNIQKGGRGCMSGP